MIKIVIDPGHGGSDRSNRGPTGYIEADGNLKTALYLKEILEENYENVEVLLTRDKDVYLTLTERGLKGSKADIFHSIHSNAGPTGAKGCEVFYSVDLPADHNIAAMMAKRIADWYDTNNRGAKTRESSKYPGEDYYTVIDVAQDNGAKHVFLSESLFHSDIREEAILKSDDELRVIAEIMATTYEMFLPLEKKQSDILKDIPEWAHEAWVWAYENGINDGVLQNQTELQTTVMLYNYHKKFG